MLPVRIFTLGRHRTKRSTDDYSAEALTNAGGAIADMFTPKDRGVASTVYSTAPYLGPGELLEGTMSEFDADMNSVVIGPIVGGYISETNVGSIPGWRFTFWLMFIIAALNWLLGFLFVPETVSVDISLVAVLLTSRSVCAHIATTTSAETAEAIWWAGALCERI